jgi:hypothetical protein
MRLAHGSVSICRDGPHSSSSLATINEYLLLKMKTEVNSQLGRSLIAMKNEKPRLHLHLGYGLVLSK